MALRTPEERFTGLPDYPFDPHYATVGDGLRLHYVDEGPREGLDGWEHIAVRQVAANRA